MPKQKQQKKRSPSTVENILEVETNQAIFAEIAFTKKRIHLVEGERKANYESSEEILKNNEARIQTLRSVHSALKKRHTQMIKSCNNFFSIISKRLGNERNAYAFRGKTLEQTIDILECRIGDMKNKINLQAFKKNQLKIKMEKIIKDEEIFRMILSDGKIPKENQRTVELKTTENATALMQMKITEAENIRARYKNMVTALKAENYHRERKVADMTCTIGVQKKEIVRMQVVLQEAQKARKAAKLKLAEVESGTIKEYTEREQELFESRMKLKQIRDRMDAIGAKLTFPKFHMIHRDSSVSDGLYTGMQATQQGETKPQSVIEIVYNRLSHMTGEADPELIVARFRQQREHSNELEAEEIEAKAEVRRSKVRKKFLQDKANQLQFSGGLRRETLDDRALLINQEMDSTDIQRHEVDKRILDYSSAMDEMLVKLHEICTKNDIKIPQLAIATTPSPSERFVGDKIIAILKYMLKKLEQILEDREEAISPAFDKDNLSEAELSTTSAILRPNSLMAEVFEDSNIMRKLSVNEESNIAMRRLSIIDMVSNEGDIVGRSIIAEAEPLADFDGIVMAPIVEKREDSHIHHSKKSDSSDEEEAVTRIAIKRQSQVLVEAKTRKGRFTPGMAMPARRRV